MGGKSLDDMRDDFDKDVQVRADVLEGKIVNAQPLNGIVDGMLYGESHVESESGVTVWVIYCTGCRIYLGVNYPADKCGECSKGTTVNTSL